MKNGSGRRKAQRLALAAKKADLDAEIAEPAGNSANIAAVSAASI